MRHRELLWMALAELTSGAILQYSWRYSYVILCGAITLLSLVQLIRDKGIGHDGG